MQAAVSGACGDASGVPLEYIMTPLDLLIDGLVVLVLFGNRLPSVCRSLGRGLTGLKKGLAGTKDDGDDPPTAGGIFARIKPHPSGRNNSPRA